MDVRRFRERALEVLSHSDGDTAIRVVLALVARQAPDSVRAIEALIQRFARQLHLIVGLLDALLFVDDPAAKIVATDALNHPAVIVRVAAMGILRHFDALAARCAPWTARR